MPKREMKTKDTMLFIDVQRPKKLMAILYFLVTLFESNWKLLQKEAASPGGSFVTNPPSNLKTT